MEPGSFAHLPVRSGHNYTEITGQGSTRQHLGDVYATHYYGPDSNARPPVQQPFTGQYKSTALQGVASFVERPALQAQLKERLHDTIEKRNDSSKILAVCGLGGAGKSQLMLNYIKTYRRDYAAVFWIDASSKQKVETDIRRIHGLLLGCDRADVDINTCVSETRQWFLRKAGPYLVVMDSADDIDVPDYSGYIDLQSYMVDAPSADLVITTRSRTAQEMTHLDAVNVAELTPEEARKLFLRRSKLPSLTPDVLTRVDMITKELGHFALAINLAAAHVAQTPRLRRDLGRYLEEYRSHRKDLLTQQRPKVHVDQYGANVLTTWETSYQAIRQQCPEACRLLSFLAFLSPHDIFSELLETDDQNSAELLLAALSVTSTDNSLQEVLDTSFAILQSYSLLERSDGKQAYSMHKLVHTWSQDRLDDNTRATFCTAAWEYLASLAFLFFDSPARAGRFTPHVTLCFTWIEKLCNANYIAACEIHRSFSPIANFLGYTGQYNYAFEVVSFSSESLCQQRLLYPVAYADSLALLGKVCADQGKFDESEQLLRQAIYEHQECGQGTRGNIPMQFRVDLAWLLMDQGKHIESEEMFRGLLAECEHLAASEQVPILLQGLAGSLYQRAKYDEAEELYRRVFASELGSEPRDLIIAERSLGMTLLKQERFKEAEVLLRRALHKASTIHGPTHHLTLDFMSNLGEVLMGQNSFEEARGLLQQAYVGLERTLGVAHVDTLRALQQLVKALRHFKGHDEALILFTNAADEYREIQGDDGKYTRWFARELAELRSFLSARASFKAKATQASDRIASALETGKHLVVSLDGGWESDAQSDTDSDDDDQGDDRCRSLTMGSRDRLYDLHRDDLIESLSERAAFKQSMQRASVRITRALKARWHTGSFWSQDAVFKERMEQASSRIAEDLEAGRHMQLSRESGWESDEVRSERWDSDSDVDDDEWWDIKTVGRNWRFEERT